MHEGGVCISGELSTVSTSVQCQLLLAIVHAQEAGHNLQNPRIAPF